MPDQKAIYAHHADQYERLVAREDYQHQIFAALNQILPLAGPGRASGLRIVELGAGTGRLTLPLAKVAQHIVALDISHHMLTTTQAKLRQLAYSLSAPSGKASDRCPPRLLTEGETTHAHGQVAVADHRYLPVGDQTADLVIAGWTIAYLVVWHKTPARSWHAELDKALTAMQRVLRPGGTIVILETLGTGHEEPYVYERLAPYYTYLAEIGFKSTWIRTDYKFASLEEAKTLIQFFFGDTMAEQVIENNWIILPECTGIWWLTP